MRMSKEQMEQEKIIVDKEMRDRCVKHYEVLEKVGRILTMLPGTELMSIEQVAAYYEVSDRWIKELYANNKEEIDADGTKILPRSYYDGSELKPTSVNHTQTSVTYEFDNGQKVIINNRGLKVFSKRAVLRIGMLLQQSEVAKELRTQLLNIEEKVPEEIKIRDISEEQMLMLNVGMAYASGNMDAVLKATTEYNAFQNRHIAKLEKDNKVLAGEILEWGSRKQLNAGIRMLASVTGVAFDKMWNELYKNLQYKYGICLKQRTRRPYIDNVEEHEWARVMQTFCAMCEAYGESPTDMFQQTTPKEKLIM